MKMSILLRILTLCASSIVVLGKCVKDIPPTDPNLLVLPIIQIVGNGSLLYAHQAADALPSLYPNNDICSNLRAQSDRFNASGFIVPLLEPTLCGTPPCVSQDTHPLTVAKGYRAGIFTAQLLNSFVDDSNVWRTLCDEMQPGALDWMLGTTEPIRLACQRAGIPRLVANEDLAGSLPATQRDELQSLEAILLGGEVRASFSTAADLESACGKIPGSVRASLSEPELDSGAFGAALCGAPDGTFPGKEGKYAVATVDEVQDHIAEYFGRVYALMIWSAGNSDAYRKMLCRGYESGLPTSFNASRIPDIGQKAEVFGGWIRERCKSAGVIG